MSPPQGPGNDGPERAWLDDDNNAVEDRPAGVASHYCQRNTDLKDLPCVEPVPNLLPCQHRGRSRRVLLATWIAQHDRLVIA